MSGPMHSPSSPGDARKASGASPLQDALAASPPPPKRSAGTPHTHTVSPVGPNYSVKLQLKESHVASPSKQASRFATSSPRTASVQEELSRLQQANAELLGKLSLLESRVPGVSRLLGLSDGCVHVNTTTARGAGKQGRTPAAAVGLEPAVVQAYGPLSFSQVEMAAMRCHYLAHYWGLAHQLRVVEEVAGQQAQYWAARAPSLAAFVARAQLCCTPYLPAGCSWPATSNEQEAAVMLAGGTEADLSWWPQLARGAASDTPQSSSACLAVLEVESEARRLAELAVPCAVQASVVHSHHHEFGDQGDTAAPCTDSQALAGTARATEVLFQTAWLAYLWAKGAQAGVLPHVASARASWWAARLHGLVTRQSAPGWACSGIQAEEPLWEVCAGHVRQSADLQAAQQEVARLGLEHHLWQSQHRPV